MANQDNSTYNPNTKNKNVLDNTYDIITNPFGGGGGSGGTFNPEDQMKKNIYGEDPQGSSPPMLGSRIWDYPRDSEQFLHGRATDTGPSVGARYQLGSVGLQDKSAWDRGLATSGGGGRAGAFDLTGRTGKAATQLGGKRMQTATNVFAQDEAQKQKMLEQLYAGRMKAWAAGSLSSEISKEY